MDVIRNWLTLAQPQRVAPPEPTVSPPARDTVTLSGDLAARVAAVKARSWHDEVVYMAMTDRFHNGDKTNDAGSVPSDPNRFHGGDFQGMIDKLDYIKGLGCTTLWISPVQEQRRDFFGMDGYHGYWATDFHKTEPSFGDLAKLKELVDKAHEKGMKVIVDLVVNHTGYGAPMAEDPKFKDWFHHYGNIKLPTRWWMEKGQFCGLPDFAQEKPEVARYLIDMAKYWIDQTGIDGYRLDAVRHVPNSFWKQFASEIHAHAGNNFLLLGEIYHPSAKTPSRYQNEGGMDSVFDFPLNFALRNTIGADHAMSSWENIKYFFTNVLKHPGESFRILQGHADGDMRRVADVIKQDSKYRRSDMLVTMLDNHDMTRFVTAAGAHGEEKLKLGLALLFTMRGIPSVYYGTEVAMAGGWDENRKDMEFGRDPAFEAHFTKLAGIRAASTALRRGNFEQLFVDHDVFAYARNTPCESAVVALNNGGEAREADIRVPAQIADGTVLQDKLGGGSYVVKGGQVHLTLAARQAVILEK